MSLTAFRTTLLPRVEAVIDLTCIHVSQFLSYFFYSQREIDPMSSLLWIVSRR
jgi:hypothetical protein